MRNTRKPIKRRQTNYCNGAHTGPWTFTTTASGVKRTCACGYSITEIGRHVEIQKGKRDQLIRSKGRVS